MVDGDGFGCMSVIVFLGVWIVCTVSFGPFGFMLGWMPALILAAIWPLVAALGVLAIILLIVIAVALYLYFQFFAPA
jgi:hypothetical protein